MKFPRYSKAEMTAEDVKFKIDLIRAAGRDYEAAHGMEDKLLWEFVEHVAADRGADAPHIALILLKWREESADQPRYCA